jgi:uncharacterized membrane protein YoaK (UPF0700 family)
MVMNITNSTQMFGVQLSSAQSSSVLAHVSDFFLILLAFLFVWFLITLIIALVIVNKGRKKGQVLWTFIVSLFILFLLLILAFTHLDGILLWIGGI